MQTISHYYVKMEPIDMTNYCHRATEIQMPFHGDVEITYNGQVLSGNEVLLGAASLKFRQWFIVEKLNNADLKSEVE